MAKETASDAHTDGPEKSHDSKLMSYANVAKRVSPAAKTDGPVVPLQDDVIC